MTIKKSSWHYRMLTSYQVSVPNNLCGYFWKVAACLLIITPLLGTLGGILVATGWFCGFKFAEKDYRFNKGLFYPYKYGIYGRAKKEFVAPWHITLASLLFYFLTTAYPKYIIEKTGAFFGNEDVKAIFIVTSAALVVMGIYILIIIGLYIGISRARRSETMALLRAWLKAKKEKVCPLLTFED